MDWIYVIILGYLWGTVTSHWGASILLHRYYCHKQFNVPVWFELWRTLNGFPPNYYQPKESGVKDKK
jgi:fatty-acid desaturase